MTRDYSIALLWKGSPWKKSSFMLPVEISSETTQERLRLKPGKTVRWTAKEGVSVMIESTFPSGKRFTRLVTGPEGLRKTVKIEIAEEEPQHQTDNWKLHQSLGTYLKSPIGGRSELVEAEKSARSVKARKAATTKGETTAKRSARTGTFIGSRLTTEIGYTLVREASSSSTKAKPTAKRATLKSKEARPGPIWKESPVLRLWTFSSSTSSGSPWVVDNTATWWREPYPEGIIVHLKDDRFQRSSLSFERPHRILELRVSGYISRFVVLPPVLSIQLMVRKSINPNHADYAGGFTVKIVPVGKEDVQLMLAYMSQGEVADIQELATSVIQSQQQSMGSPQVGEAAVDALYEKGCDPFAAIVGGYYLIRTNRFTDLEKMPENLSRVAPTIPDASLIHVWQLMTDPGSYGLIGESLIDTIKLGLIETARRGIPIFSMGLRFLFERLRVVEAHISEDNPARSDFSAIIGKFGRLLDASDKGEQFTTFFGLNPYTPGTDKALSFQDAGFVDIQKLPRSRKNS